MPTIEDPSYYAWEKVCGDIYEALPDRISVPCPNCGHDALRMEFVAKPSTRFGYSACWCDHCLRGIQNSRVYVPEGVNFRVLGTPWEELEKVIPEYTTIEPPYDPGMDDADAEDAERQ